MKKIRVQISRSFNYRKMFEILRRETHSMVSENGNEREAMDDKIHFRSEGGNPSSLDGTQQIGSVYNRASDNGAVSSLSKEGAKAAHGKDSHVSDMEHMKERFAKLLLGEDMSGGGKGVSSALALSNAITNLAASVFGEQRKLEPMSQERKAMWRKEIDWLLSVTDHIVELIPSQQKSQDGTTMEIMVTQQRKDLLINIPALRKLDAILIDCLDNFTDNEFWYVSEDADESEKGVQRNEKWWLPTVRLPPSGLSEASRKWLQHHKDCVNQVQKASMAINAQVLSEMEIPEGYIESLPKNGRACLGDLIYKSITDEFLDPNLFLSTMDLTSEHKVVDLKNRMEASIVIWKRKIHHKDFRSPWSSAISLEKRELFEERAETILLLLKQRFPGLPQSTLDITKIQYNRDVGYSILESYSRVLESLANAIMSRIEDVLYADSLTQDPSFAVSKLKPSAASPLPSPRFLSAGEDADKLSCSGTPTPTSMTLSDFMGWNLEDERETAGMKKNRSLGNLESYAKYENDKTVTKLGKVLAPKKFIEMIESGLRSPTARH